MSSYSEGQTHQLMNALEAAEFTAEDVTRLGQFSDLRGIRFAVRGQAEIVVTKHIIDLDADPFVPGGWTLEEHRKGGQFEWDSARVALYLSPEQQGRKVIKGDRLRDELKGKPVFNANLLDYLLANPQLIPEEWKGKFVFFWGTIYRDSDGCLYVRCLFWGGGRWYWDGSWLDGDWGGYFPAAVPAS
jgi:hypothetical protein